MKSFFSVTKKINNKKKHTERMETYDKFKLNAHARRSLALRYLTGVRPSCVAAAPSSLPAE